MVDIDYLKIINRHESSFFVAISNNWIVNYLNQRCVRVQISLVLSSICFIASAIATHQAELTFILINPPLLSKLLLTLHINYHSEKRQILRPQCWPSLPSYSLPYYLEFRSMLFRIKRQSLQLNNFQNAIKSC